MLLIACCFALASLQVASCAHLGIQVSAEDGDIDWQTVRRKNLPNIAFAMIKGSEGADMDPRFEQNFGQARQADIFQTKYVHVFRTQERDNVPGSFVTRDVSIGSQIQRIKKMMHLVNFDVNGHANRAKDELVIRIQQVAGDPGLNGGLPNSRLFARVQELVQELNSIGIRPILQTDKQFWDNFVYAGDYLGNGTETLCLDNMEPHQRINRIPLSVCSCAVERFAPLARGTLASLPLGLDVNSDDEKNAGDDSGYYYWHFSDTQRVNGIKDPVALVMRVLPFQRPRMQCRWRVTGPDKPYPTYPIPVDYSGDHWRRGVPHDNYSRRCKVMFANPLGVALPALVAVMVG